MCSKCTDNKVVHHTEKGKIVIKEYESYTQRLSKNMNKKGESLTNEKRVNKDNP